MVDKTMYLKNKHSVSGMKYKKVKVKDVMNETKIEIPSTKFTKQCWKEFFGRDMEEPNPECFTAELCDFANYMVRRAFALRPTPLAPDAANGDGIACPICGEKSYCIHRDN